MWATHGRAASETGRSVSWSDAHWASSPPQRPGRSKRRAGRVIRNPGWCEWRTWGATFIQIGSITDGAEGNQSVCRGGGGGHHVWVELMEVVVVAPWIHKILLFYIAKGNGSIKRVHILDKSESIHRHTHELGEEQGGWMVIEEGMCGIGHDESWMCDCNSICFNLVVMI